MIALGLRFSLSGGREAGARLVFTALGVAVCVTLLLFTLSGFNGISAKQARETWLLRTSIHNRVPSVDETTSDPLWWRLVYDSYGRRPLLRLEIAATGVRAPRLPGVARLPQVGEYYVSPALAQLIAATPSDILRARFPGRQVGIIAEPGLPAPDSLLAVIGREPAQLSDQSGAIEVRSVETALPEHNYSIFLRVVLGIGAAGLLVPVLVFVATAALLAAARREERFAALRLVGATPSQVNLIAAVESGFGAVAGTAAGFLCFWLLRPLVARIPFTGDPFFPGDLTLGWLAIASVAVGVPLIAMLASMVTMRRVHISPLGVTRRVTPEPPHPRRLVLVVLGLGVLAAAHFLTESIASVWVLVAAFVLMIVGLMVAGPWLTMVGARLLTKVAKHGATLIASRRLSDNPGRAFRAISGLILTVFVGTVFVGVVGTAINTRGAALDPISLPPGAVSQWCDGYPEGGLPPADANNLLAHVMSLQGVRSVVPVRAPIDQVNGDKHGLVAATDWCRLPTLDAPHGRGDVVSVDIDALLSGHLHSERSEAGPAPAGGLSSRPLRALIVVTDGHQESIERVRTALQAVLPAAPPAFTASQLDTGDQQLTVLQRMVDVGIVLSLIIAGCSLAVSVASSLIERRRSFTLLRLAGMPFAHLRRVVVLEAAVPLVSAALASAGTGFLAADLILRTTGDYGVSLPPISYFLIIGGGLAAALGVVCATLPLLRRLTEVRAVRME